MLKIISRNLIPTPETNALKEALKKIGEGWQYSVYDLGNERVLKKFHSFIKSYWVVLKTIFPFRDDPMMMIPDFSRSMKRKALVSFEILKLKCTPFIGQLVSLDSYCI